MANKLFKGFLQVTEGSFDATEGYLYLVRPSDATEYQDGYLLFNGKKYGTAALVEDELKDLIGILPEGETDIVTYVQGLVQEASHTHSNMSTLNGITDQKVADWDAADPNVIEGVQVNGTDLSVDGNKKVNVQLPSATVSGTSNGVEVTVVESAGTITDVTVTAPDFANTYAGKSATESAITDLTGSAHTHDNKALLDTYTQTESDLADAVSKKHAHSNGTILDGISQNDIDAWNDGQANVIEGVQVNGTDLTPDGNKKVNVELPSATVSGASATNDVSVEVVQSAGTITGVNVTAPDFANTYAGKSATESAISDLNDSAHTHANGTELDLIQTGDVAKWNALSTGASVVVSAYTANPDLTDGMLKTYKIYQGGSLVGTIDIPKDMVVASGETVTVNDVKYLRLHIANSNTPVDIPVSDLAHVYSAGDGIEISNSDEISAKVVEQNGLSVDSTGIQMAVADSAHTGAMSASDKEKLDGIEAGAEVNAIEGITVNGGNQINPDASRVVDIALPSATASGSSNGVQVTVEESAGTITAVTVTAPDFANTYASKDVESAVTSLQGSAHTHDNINVLSAITAQDVAAWDAALQHVATGSTCMSVSESNGTATVDVVLSQDTGNALEKKNDGLYAAIYYDGDDSNMPS